MGLLTRRSFARGWVPDADAVNGPVDALLRADNTVLDEFGVVALRPGSTTRLGPLADLDVHSLYSTVLNGTKRRYAGAGNNVYVDGTLLTGMAGSGDVAFGSYLGQVLFARGSATKKHDGASLRNWGLATPAAPTITPLAADGKTFATGDSGEAPAFTWDEDNGTGASWAAGHDGAANGALVLNPAATNRGSVTKTFASPTDFTTYDSGGAGGDDDLLSLYFYADEPTNLLSLQLMIDVSDGSFQSDYYTHTFTPGTGDALSPRSTSSLPTTVAGSNRHRVRGRLQDEVGDDDGSAFTAQRQERRSWSKLQIRRGDLERIGSTSGFDWTTVKAIRYVVRATGTVETRFDTCRITQAGLTGSYQWIAVAALDTGTYVGLSAPSPASRVTQMAAATASIAVSGIDGQANRVYVFRMGGVMDNFYRVAVKTSGGAGTVPDTTSDVQAMSDDIVLEADNGPPPANIISVAGPHFDRVFALTSAGAVWPSRRVNPDSFATGQILQVCGPDETALWVRQAFNGLFVGTTKDLYAIEGDGAELPDGEINFRVRALHVDHPPVNDGVAQSGSLLLYVADDGWRAWTGGGTESIAGETSLLYRGRVRYGRGPFNVATGRWRAVVHKGQLVTTAPENTETTSTVRVIRQAPRRGAWYYHTYPTPLRVLHREPDGTLLAGDTAGRILELDTGTSDNGTAIPIVLWTIADDDGQPITRKVPIDLRVLIDTGGAAASVAVHLNDTDTPATTLSATATGFAELPSTLGEAYVCRQLQLRVTGSFTAFHFYGFTSQYEALPVPVRGKLLPTDFGDPRVKTLSGLQIRICTPTAPRTLTPWLDNVAQTAFSISTDTVRPSDLTLPFPASLRAVQIALQFDDDVEVYTWRPIVTSKNPLGVLSWDTGPIDLSAKELTWLRRADVKVNAGAPLVLSLYFDGALVTQVTSQDLSNLDTVIPIDVPRGTKGRQPRVVVTSSAVFHPYWVRFIERGTGYGTDKTLLTVPFTEVA